MRKLDRFSRSLDWNLLKYFVQIAHTGGIGTAAESLRLSQPSVSAALRRLEAQVGAQLCVRSRQGVQLTAAGEQLLKHCNEIVARLSVVPGELRPIAGTMGGSVVLRTISHVHSSPLDAGIVAFKRQYPDVELILQASPWAQIVDALLSGDSAVGVGFHEAPHGELNYALLARERLQLYCGPTHELSAISVVTPASLSDQPFIAFSDGEPPTLRAFRERYGLGQRISGIADNVYEASWLIGLGLGIGSLPEPMAATVSPRLIPLLPPSMVPELEIHLMWRRDLQDRAARLLIDTILDQIVRGQSAPG